MTPIDWNNSNTRTRSRTWGRFGEPEQSYSPREDSLKLPRRRGSFDGDIYDSDYSEEETPECNNKTNNKTNSSNKIINNNNNTMLSSSNHSKNSRQCRRSMRLRSPMDFKLPSLERSSADDYFRTHLRELDEMMPANRTQERRASTGTKFAPNSILFGPTITTTTATTATTATTIASEEEETQRPRRISISGPRPCMESSLGSLQANLDGPIFRRRGSLGGTRPCMEHTSGTSSEAHYDGPILRPYRQLSSENLALDMCIGEETDEDLSNRSMLRTTDMSNRSNRSFVPDFSSRSNRSCLPDFSSRSNHSCFRTADFSSRSRTTVAVSDFLGEQQAAASPVHEEPEIFPVSQDEPQEPHSETTNRNPTATSAMTQKTTNSRPEPWPIISNSCKNDKGKRPSIFKSKTWPSNLMILLSIRRRSLRNLDCSDSDEENDSITNDGSNSQHKRRTCKSHSPCRKNILLQTIHSANEVMELMEPRIYEC